MRVIALRFLILTSLMTLFSVLEAQHIAQKDDKSTVEKPVSGGAAAKAVTAAKNTLAKDEKIGGLPASSVTGAATSTEPPSSSRTALATGTGTAPALNYRYEAKGRRDPFKSLDVVTAIQATTAPIVRPPGLKGQLVSEINVVGIVKSKDGYMALANGYRGKTFFIHSKDELYDGKVLQIKSDTVVFSQTLTDNLGRKITHEVVKKLYPTRGEGKDEK